MIIESKWAYVNGDTGRRNWALIIPNESKFDLPISSLKEIKGTSFLSRKEAHSPAIGEATIYHEEHGNRHYTKSSVKLGYYDHFENLWYIIPDSKHKRWLYQNGVINRNEYDGSGNHLAAVRILLGLRRMALNPSIWKTWINDDDCPFKNMLQKWIDSSTEESIDESMIDGFKISPRKTKLRVLKPLVGEISENELGYYLYQLNKHVKNLVTYASKNSAYELKDEVIDKYIEDVNPILEEHYASYDSDYDYEHYYDVFDFVRIGEYAFHFNPRYRQTKMPEGATCISEDRQFISKRVVLKCDMTKARRHLKAYVDGKLKLKIENQIDQQSIA